jgi:hypothetical protein
VTGTLGVLRSGAEQHLVKVPDLLERLKATSFYLDETLLNSVFEPRLKSLRAAILTATRARRRLTVAPAAAGVRVVLASRQDDPSGRFWEFGREHPRRSIDAPSRSL